MVGQTATIKGVKKIRAPIMVADRKFLSRHLRHNIRSLMGTKEGAMETIPGNTKNRSGQQCKQTHMVSIINQVMHTQKFNK